jgi:hypothetical protein
MDVENLAGFRPPTGAATCLNYLHFGESLATLSELVSRTEVEGEATEVDLLTRLETLNSRKGRGVADAADVLRAVAGPQGRVCLAQFRHDLEMSLKFREVFRSLRCRGFSFRLREDPILLFSQQGQLFIGCRGFSFRLREDPPFGNLGFSSDVGMKFALIADRGLYYPPKVRQGLPAAEPENRHVADAIGWLFIMEKTMEGQRWWYVTNVQSDLMSLPVSCLKEIFRGWQRVLFLLVVGLARQRGVTAIAIPSSKLMAERSGVEDVARRRDRAWQGLYDGVAEFFAMSPTQYPYPTNLQPVWFARPPWCYCYYVGNVAALIESVSGRSADPANCRTIGQ